MGSLFMTRFRMGLALAGTLGAPWAAAPASPRAQVVSEFQGAQGLPELLERRQELQRRMGKLEERIESARERESERENRKLIRKVFRGKLPPRMNDIMETLAARRGFEGVYSEDKEGMTLAVFARMEDGTRRHVDTLELGNREGLVGVDRRLGELAKEPPERKGSFTIDGAPKEALARLRENGYQVDFQRGTLRIPDGSDLYLAIGSRFFPHDITLQARPDADPVLTMQPLDYNGRPTAPYYYKLTREKPVRRPPDETAD